MTRTPTIAHQRLIREAQEAQGDFHQVPSDFSNAVVREISHSEAKKIILKYEWLGNMGSTRRSFGLFFDGELAGVECFGSTAGSGVSYICGSEHRDRVITLIRGACVYWAHPHSASFLIRRACQILAKEGKNIFVAYSDTEAGEIGTIYQASNWFYCGMTETKGDIIVAPDGTVRDARILSELARERHKQANGSFFRKETRQEVKNRLIRAGYSFMPRTAKHRYVGIYAESQLKGEFSSSLRWPVLPYPKRLEYEPIQGRDEQTTHMNDASVNGTNIDLRKHERSDHDD